MGLQKSPKYDDSSIQIAKFITLNNESVEYFKLSEFE